MIIESSRLILRLWQESDINDLIEGLNNINVSKWMASIPFPYTQKDAIDFIKYVRNEDVNEHIHFAIVLKEDNKVIGGTEIRNIDKRNGTAGGGIWINENYQKNGYGTEAFCIRNRYIFNELNLRRIENGYFPNNEKSHNMQLKLGYKDEGIKRKRFICMATNEYVDECITGLLKEEFIDKYFDEMGE